MESFKRYFLTVLGSLILLALSFYALLLVFLPTLIDINKYKTALFTQVQKNTGFAVSAEDIDFRTSFSPYLNLYAHHVKVFYPDGTVFVKITDANVKLKVIPLLFKTIKLDSIELTRPIANFTLYSDCTTSFEKYLEQTKQKNVSSEGNNLLNFKLDSSIPKIKLNRYKIKIKDVAIQYPFEFIGDKLIISNFDISKGLIVQTKGYLQSNEYKHFNYDVVIESFFSKKNNKFFNISPFRELKKYDLRGDVYARVKSIEKDGDIQIFGEAAFNNLQFQIASKHISNNFIKLVFNSNNINIDALLHTSLKDTAKISGSYIYGLKQRIDLNVKAKNTDLSDLHEIMCAVLNSLNIKSQLNNFSISGLADLDFKIKSNFKKIESSGVAKVINAQVNCKGAPLSITGINSNIDFSNNIIKINKSTALVNSTPIEILGNIDSNANAKIIIDAQNLELNKILKNLPFDNKLKGYDVVDGILFIRAYITGKLNDVKINITTNIKNIDFQSKKDKIDIKSSYVVYQSEYYRKVAVSSLKFSNLIICFDNSIKLNAKTFLMSVYPELINITPSKISFGSDFLTVGGQIKNYKSAPKVEINYKGRLDSLELNRILYKYIKLPSATNGALQIAGSLDGTVDDLDINAKILADKLNYVSFLAIKELLYKPSVLNVSAKIKNNLLDISDISLFQSPPGVKLDKLFKQNLAFSDKYISLSGKIKDFNNLFFNDFKIDISKPVTVSVSGLQSSEITLKSGISVNGRLNKPNISGNLNIKSLNIPQYNLKAEDFDLLFEPDNIKAKAQKFLIDNSYLAFEANILPDFTKNINIKNITVNASYLDLLTFINSFSNLAGKDIYPGYNVPVKINKGTALINNFKFDNINARNIHSDFSLNNNLLKFNNLNADAYNGKATANISYNLLKQATVISLRGYSLDAAPAMFAITGVNDNIQGKLDCILSLTAFGNSRNQFIKSLRGNAQINIVNGQLGTLGKFERFLYAQNLMSQSIMKSTVNAIVQLVAKKDTGRLKYLNMTIDFEDGFADVASLKFSGPNMSMYATGKLNMLTNSANFEILGKVSNEVVSVLGPFGELSLSNIVSNIPKLNNMTLPNIFYNNYNLTVSRDTLDKIPDLTPKTDLKTKDFMVLINGNLNSVKSVKLFKWLAPLQGPASSSNISGSDEHPLPQEHSAKPVPGLNKYNRSKINKSFDEIPVQKTSEPSKKRLPSFLDNLPDDFH